METIGLFFIGSVILNFLLLIIIYLYSLELKIKENMIVDLVQMGHAHYESYQIKLNELQDTPVTSIKCTQCDTEISIKDIEGSMGFI